MAIEQASASQVEIPNRADPITFEIVRHRLWSIADEMAMVLIRTAGNPTITEAHDFMVAMFTPDGSVTLGGWGGNRHLSCTSQACKGILARFPESDIHEDDVYLLNDPYVAAIHQQDVYVVSPVHFEGELMGWIANFTHLADIGGIDPGTSPRATEVTQEGLRIPGLKLVDRGVLRYDVMDTLLNMTREPEMNALQLKAQMAANHTGKQKLRQLVQKIGLGTYRVIVDQMIGYSENALRSRLRELPDGTWRTREYYDTKDRIYTIKLAMTKEDDRLAFDFTGTSEQAPNFVNCTYWGTRGGIFVSVSSMLGFGLPWNEGLLRPLSLTVPEGTILNAKFPGPVSAGTTAASRLATTASWNAVSNMLAMSDRYGDEISALWTSGAASIRIAGINRDNRYFVLTPFAETGGGGARRFADGVETCGTPNNPMRSVPNTETLERNAPVLYLYRRQLPDSGGPGTYRGGVSDEIAFVMHKAPKGTLKCVYSGSGREPAMSHGLFGGLPGCNTFLDYYSGTRVRDALCKEVPADLDALGGDRHRLPPQGLFDIDDSCVVTSRSDGGGGMGDPLLRHPDRVLADIQTGLVSVDQAQSLYGVELNAARTTVDGPATDKLRERIRLSRGASGFAGGPPNPKTTGNRARVPVVVDTRQGATRCASCSLELESPNGNWKIGAVKHERPLSALGRLWTSTMFVLRSFSCPRCGSMLDAEMTLPNDPPIHTFSPPERR